MMRGACFVYSYTKNEELYQILTTTVKDILTTMDDLGRISSYPVDKELSGWDVWSRKYVLLGLQYFMEICTDVHLNEQIVDSMIKQVDRLSYFEDWR